MKHNVKKNEFCYYCTECHAASGDGLIGKECVSPKVNKEKTPFDVKSHDLQCASSKSKECICGVNKEQWSGELTGWRKSFVLRMVRLGSSITEEEMREEFEALKSLADQGISEAISADREKFKMVLEELLVKCECPDGDCPNCIRLCESIDALAIIHKEEEV